MAKRLNLLGMTIFLALLTAYGTLRAETEKQDVDRHFSLLDIDGDGIIDRLEAGAHPALTQHFRRMDKNRDGGVSKRELTTYRLAPHNQALGTVRNI